MITDPSHTISKLGLESPGSETFLTVISNRDPNLRPRLHQNWQKSLIFANLRAKQFLLTPLARALTWAKAENCIGCA